MVFDFEYFDMAMRGDCIEASEDVLEKKERTKSYNGMTHTDQQLLYMAVSNALNVFTTCPNEVCEV